MLSPGREKAAFHELRARNYRRQARLLLEREQDPDCAGALLYESVKQCINALANQQGIDPLSTAAKFHFLRDLTGVEPGLPYPIQRWRAADRLHINADRGHLAAPQFMEYWAQAESLIDDLLELYAGRE